MTHPCMTPWSGVEVTQTYEAVFVWVRLYVHRYIRLTLESLRLQVESPVLGTSIAVTLCLSCRLRALKRPPVYHQGLKTPVEVYSESCPLASVTVRAFVVLKENLSSSNCLSHCQAVTVHKYSFVLVIKAMSK